VTADQPTIIASSIGYRSRGRGPLDWRPGPVYRFAADLANAGDRPRLCFLNQALGDPADLTAALYAAFVGTGFDVSHLALFPMPNIDDVRGHLLSQDVIWVNGGSVANLVAVWRAHGLDEILRECWQAGVVLGGCSAGSLCWNVGGTTDSFGPDLRAFTGGLGFLPYSNGVHYDAEGQRRPLLHRLVADGTLPDGYATDNHAALVFRGTRLVEAVADDPKARGYAISRAPDGSVTETVLATRLLEDQR
jgi:peptidase E